MGHFTFWISLLSYHLSCCGLDLPQLTLCWPIAHAVREWEESVGVFPGVGDVPLPPCFCWRCVCLRGRKKEDRRALCLLFYELGLYVEFLWGCALLIVPELASSVILTLARTRGLGALKPGYTPLSKKFYRILQKNCSNSIVYSRKYRNTLEIL